MVIIHQIKKNIITGNKAKILKIQNKALELSMFLSLPASIALVIGSEEIISALFGYGSFNNEAVSNSAKALFYFSLGLPAFGLIKVFSTFFFANHDTKTPFYISLIAVTLNVLVSVYYFKSIGFIIIPIATTFSSWFNAVLLFIFLKNRDLFNLNKTFLVKFLKILFASIFMGIFFNFVLSIFKNELIYDYKFKSLYLILSVSLGLIFYIILSYLIKAFNSKDLQLKY